MSEGERVVRGAQSPVEVTLGFLRSSVGAKVIMALTGLVLWGFVIGHLVGNLQVFQGPEPLNAYGEMLHTLGHGAAIWIVRAVLLVVVVSHIFFGLRLARLNRAARGPVGYRMKKPMRTNAAALTMAASGILILAFIVFHLFHFTIGGITALPPLDDKNRTDVFTMVFTAFKTPWIVVVYVVGQSLLLSHLMHGTVSLWQSLGLHHPVWTPALKVIGRTLGILIFAGNIGIPLAIFLFWK
jgi:succinate dehydrogenase / fumarate reductase cytochrome b subunit